MLDTYLVTCNTMPEPDPDEALLVAALVERGLNVQVAAWNDPTIDWSGEEMAVIRSTWDYHHHLEKFLAWCDSVVNLVNPAPVIHWNCDKKYLKDLWKAGLPVVPTTFIPDSSGIEPMLAAQHGTVVVKPAVSGGSFNTFVGDASDPEIAKSVELILQSSTAMVQPYIESVEKYGERSLVWIDGRLTHSIRKTPRFAGDHEVVSESKPIEDDERDLAEQTLTVIARDFGFDDLLYARIDLARDVDDTPMLMELELIEPSLFLLQYPRATDLFADAITFRAKR